MWSRHGRFIPKVVQPLYHSPILSPLITILDALYQGIA
jgi:hypothetical protein